MSRDGTPCTRPTMHAQALARLRETFGEPDGSLQRNDHWTVRPKSGGLAIYVLVVGTGDQPAIWSFDSRSRDDGVMFA